MRIADFSTECHTHATAKQAFQASTGIAMTGLVKVYRQKSISFLPIRSQRKHAED
jgi:hypothetical protein